MGMSILDGLVEASRQMSADDQAQGLVQVWLDTGAVLFGWVVAADALTVSITRATRRTEWDTPSSDLVEADFLLHLATPSIIGWGYISTEDVKR